MKKISLKDFEKYHNELIGTKELLLVKHNSEKPLICYYDGLNYNDNYDYNKINTGHSGGCYIAFDGDYMVVYFFKEESEIKNFINNVILKFVDKLKELLPDENIEFTGNDILINGKKISGASSSDYAVFFIGYNPDLNVIREVCNKEMLKTPGGLKEYLSNEQVERILEDIINEFEIEIN